MTAPTAASAPSDADRLAKLWEAYRAQEEDYQEALHRVERLTREMEEHGLRVADRERVLAEKDAEIRRLQDVVSDKDVRIRQLEALEQDVRAIETYKDRIRELEAQHAADKERLAKLFLLYEEATKGGT